MTQQFTLSATAHPWRPGEVVLLTDDNVTSGNYAGDKRAVPVWDREWDKPDIAQGGHIKIDDASIGESVLVLHVTRGIIKASALVLTHRGRVGYVHADEVMITGRKEVCGWA